MEHTRTFETRLKIVSTIDNVLHECTHLFAHIKHRLFADIASGKKPSELKNDYLACYEITARQFNALRVLVEGKIASIKSCALSKLQMQKRESPLLQQKSKNSSKP